MSSPLELPQPVTLRVYDLSDGAAAVWSPVLLGKKIRGIWHTGIVVYGMEYFYGGGIVKMKSTDVENSYGIRVAREHFLGVTTVSQREFEEYLFSIKGGFTRECYDLIKWNCNNFTDHACQYLTKRKIPSYILELPQELTQTFIGKLIINCIKLFSDAPAIDSDAAHHPRQTLALPSSPSRRRSCPAGSLRATRPRRSFANATSFHNETLSQLDPSAAQAIASNRSNRDSLRLSISKRMPSKVTFQIPGKRNSQSSQHKKENNPTPAPPRPLLQRRQSDIPQSPVSARRTDSELRRIMAQGHRRKSAPVRKTATHSDQEDDNDTETSFPTLPVYHYRVSLCSSEAKQQGHSLSSSWRFWRSSR